MQSARVAVVTGASRGIGAAIASRLAARGDLVAGLSRGGMAPDGVLGISCDVTDVTAIDAALGQVRAELGPIGVLVVNAGVLADQLAVRMSDDQWRQVLDVDLTGAFNVVRAVLPDMVRARFGRIVLVSSVVAAYGSAGQINYAAAKAGLVGMGRSLAKELAAVGVTVNSVLPGYIDTDLTAELAPERLAEVPVGRLGQPAEVAELVEFLTRDTSGYLTGASVPIDGGLGMGL